MDSLFTFIVSIFEWVVLLIFPIILLGYNYRQYLLPNIFIATFMSLLSLGFHVITNMPVAMIVSIQILILLILVKYFFKFNLIEAMTVTSIGYGFYIFFQMILIEFIVQIYKFEHIQFYLLANLKYTTQFTTFFFVIIFCFFMHRYKFQLNELRRHLRMHELKNKYKIILLSNSLLMFFFLFLNFYYMLIEDFEFKFTFLLIIMVVLFVILLSYLILHMKFQNIRLIESKKFYLDQEQQAASFLKEVQSEYETHFQAILKLYEKNSTHLIKGYIEDHKLNKVKTIQNSLLPTYKKLAESDELLYSFLVNKQKLAGLLGVTLKISNNSIVNKPISLQYIRFLNIIIDDITSLLYKNSNVEEKIIDFYVYSTNHEIKFDVSCNLHLNKVVAPNLKIYDALLQFKKNNAIVHSELDPLHVSISIPTL